MNPLVVEYTRGGYVEAQHIVDATVVTGADRTIASFGQVDRRVVPRSCIKPFTGVTFLTSGAEHEFGLTPAELTMCIASQGGEVHQREVLNSLLTKTGVQIADLRCGMHEPMHFPTRIKLEREGLKPDVLHHNSAGRHIAMVALSKLQAAPSETYLDVDHPVQRSIMNTIGALTGTDPKSYNFVSERCGAPLPLLSLRQLALGMARLGSRAEGTHPEAYERLTNAVQAHPELIAWKGHFVSDFTSLGRGRLFVKDGSEGACVATLTPEGLGIALKVRDGGNRAVPYALFHLLSSIGALERDCLQKLENVLDYYAGDTIGKGTGRVCVRSKDE